MSGGAIVSRSPMCYAYHQELPRNYEHRVQLHARSTKDEQRPVIRRWTRRCVSRTLIGSALEALNGPFHDVGKRRCCMLSAGNDERQKSLQKVQWSDAANEKVALEMERKDLHEYNADARTRRSALA